MLKQQNVGLGAHYSAGGLASLIPTPMQHIPKYEDFHYKRSNTFRRYHDCHGKHVFGLNGKGMWEQDELGEVMRSFETKNYSP